MGKEDMQKFYLSVTFDYIGYPDCYHGHGRSRHDTEVLACLFFEVPVCYRETVGDIVQMIIEDVNGKVDPIEFLNEAEQNLELQEEIAEFLTDERLEEAIRRAIGPDVKDSEPFFEDNSEDTEELVDSLELLSLIGYIHVYRA